MQLIIVENNDQQCIKPIVSFLHAIFVFSVRKGTPSRNELQGLANEIHADGESWMNLGRQLNITEPKITAIDNQNKGLSEKAYKMLLHWKQANASAAKYKVLFEALNKVNRRDLAEAYCCVKED